MLFSRKMFRVFESLEGEMKAFRLLFGKRSSARKQALKRSVRRAVAATSRGNINLQYGRFIMREDIEKLRAKNLSHDFTQCR